MDWMSIGLLLASGAVLDRFWLALRRGFRLVGRWDIPVHGAERRQMFIKDGEL